jgi:hypothetical protein
VALWEVGVNDAVCYAKTGSRVQLTAKYGASEKSIAPA